MRVGVCDWVTKFLVKFGGRRPLLGLNEAYKKPHEPGCLKGFANTGQVWIEFIFLYLGDSALFL